MYPLLFTPVYKDYIWGGQRIPKRYGRDPQSGICAESWEISDRPEGMSVVCNGAFAGRQLHELVETLGPDLLGQGRLGPVFPLLIKIIDAEQRLSVQVHPNDETAAHFGGEAKTEMWYVLDAGPCARVFAGVKSGVGPDEFRSALERKRLEDVLNAVPIRPGQVVFTPGGRVHAIGEGCLLLEIQQNSNTTYRVYDWGRVGPDGHPRALHTEQAFQVIQWSDEAPLTVEPQAIVSPGVNRRWRILSCPHFLVERLVIDEPETFQNDGASFHALFTESGKVRVKGNDRSEYLGPGTSCLLPAALNRYALVPEDGQAVVLRTRVPE